jgi:hypothetical protein
MGGVEQQRLIRREKGLGKIVKKAREKFLARDDVSATCVSIAPRCAMLCNAAIKIRAYQARLGGSCVAPVEGRGIEGAIMLARSSEALERIRHTAPSLHDMRDVVPKTLELMAAHVEVVMARKGSAEEAKARKRRNTLAGNFSLDEKRLAAMFVQSIGVVLNYW